MSSAGREIVRKIESSMYYKLNYRGLLGLLFRGNQKQFYLNYGKFDLKSLKFAFNYRGLYDVVFSWDQRVFSESVKVNWVSMN